MNHRRENQASGTRGFTVVELLVVIAIVAILAALLMIGIGGVRNSARKVETLSQFGALDAGLETYRTVSGGPYPPSASDAPGGKVVHSPFDAESTRSAPEWTGDNELVRQPPEDQLLTCYVSGANLLVWALAGADLLGSPGFEDLNGDGLWADDTFAGGPGGLYSLTADAEPVHPRMDPFVDLSKTSIKTFGELEQDAMLKEPDFYAHYSTRDRVFVDPFGYPIVYYRANSPARHMTAFDPTHGVDLAPGVYNLQDNMLFSGMGEGAGLWDKGVDFGAGPNQKLCQTEVSRDPQVSDLASSEYDGTFGKYLWQRHIAVRNEPVNEDSYVLISPGPDALYGTTDDITNFNR